MAKVKAKDIVIVAGAGALLSYLLIPAVKEKTDEIAGAGLTIIKETGYPIYNTIERTFTTIKETAPDLSAFYNYLASGTSAIGDAVSDAVDGIVDIAEGTIKEIGGKPFEYIGGVWKRIITWQDYVGAWVGGAYEGVKDVAKVGAGYTASIGTGALIGAGIGSVVPVLGTAVGGLVGGTTGGLTKGGIDILKVSGIDVEKTIPTITSFTKGFAEGTKIATAKTVSVAKKVISYYSPIEGIKKLRSWLKW